MLAFDVEDHAGRFAGKPEPGNAAGRGQFHEQRKHRGMDVEIEMPVDVRGPAPDPFFETIELGLDFEAQFLAQAPIEKQAQTRGDRIGMEKPVAAHQMRNPFRRKNRPAFAKNQVQAQFETWTGPGQGNRVGGVRCRDHQGSRSQQTPAVGGNHGLVQSPGQTEVVGTEDHAFLRGCDRGSLRRP